MSNGGRFFSNNWFLEDSHSSSSEKVQMLSIFLIGAKIFLNLRMFKQQLCFLTSKDLSTYSKVNLRYFSAIEDAVFHCQFIVRRSTWMTAAAIFQRESLPHPIPPPSSPQLNRQMAANSPGAGRVGNRLPPLEWVCGWPRRSWTWAASSLAVAPQWEMRGGNTSQLLLLLLGLVELNVA